MEKKHLQRLSGGIIYEKGVINMEDLSQRELYLKSKEELVDMILNRKEELAVKKTSFSGSTGRYGLDYDEKFHKLKLEFPQLSEGAIKHLIYLKDNRKFVETEDGITVSNIERD